MEVLIGHSLETQIKDLIGVTRPCFALENLQLISENLLQCELTVENTTSGESSPISAAEAGRHLAILGSCALAIQNPVVAKHYYLANEAYLERPIAAPIRTKIRDNRLVALAQVIMLTAKAGKVKTRRMTLEGEIIYDLEVSYTILKAGVFQKLFSKHYQAETALVAENPFAQTAPIQQLDLGGIVVTGELGRVQADMCPGHFDHYPALPIAILSAALLKLGGIHLNRWLGKSNLRYVTKRVALSASQLAFVGEHIFLRSQFLESYRDTHTFLVTAPNAAGQDFGMVAVTFDLIG